MKNALGGGPVQTYDIRATLIDLFDGMSTTFETVSSSDGSMDDFRVVVTKASRPEPESQRSLHNGLISG